MADKPKIRTFSQLLDYNWIDAFFQQIAESEHYVHLIDLPFRMTSTWQERGCELSFWEQDGKAVAWAVFQPAWQNLDYFIAPAAYSSSLEEAILEWGKTEIQAYAERMNEPVCGYVELFEDAPNAKQVVANLHEYGFVAADEYTLRFRREVPQTSPRYPLPEGFSIRPSLDSETVSYRRLVDVVFSPRWMTDSWRMRLLQHPSYVQDLDLVAVSPEDELVGFCSGWQRADVGQIEPLGVHPDYQGKGLGRALEAAMFDAMQRRNVSSVYVDHGSGNEKAIALSQKAGFRHYRTILRFHLTV